MKIDLVLFLSILAWGGSAVSSAEPPLLLSQTGLYSDIGAKTIQAGNRPYDPQYSLWSDGAEKSRWIFLPPNTQINTGKSTGPTSPPKGNIDYWIFPVGTKFWKEFRYASSTGQFQKRVETRWMEKTDAMSWAFATYLWSEDESDAKLAPATGLKDYYLMTSGVTHDIPSTTECLSCHNRGGDQVLGFDALQLSSDRDPLAPHFHAASGDAMTLERLAQENLASYLSPDLLQHPPKIHASSPEARASMGYFHANCGNCHNPTGPAGFTYLLFRYPIATLDEASSPTFTSAVDKPCYQYKIPGQSQCFKIKSGDPSLSAVLSRMKDTGTHRMPPLGSKVVDAEAVGLIESWINKLGK